MTDEARKAKNEYQKKWRTAHPENTKKYNLRLREKRFEERTMVKAPAKFPVLEYELVRQGVMKKEIAEMLHIHPSVISRKISGKAEFTLSEALAISKKLGVPVDELFTEKE